MTTVFTSEEQCFVCGNTSEQTGCGSTSAFGAPDLDGRPPELERSTIGLRVQRCPSCGYCSGSISEGSAKTSAIVKSAPYQSQLVNPAFPELADKFLCWAILEEDEGQQRVGAHLQIQAAWACDDDGNNSAATECRLKAVASIEKSKAMGIALFPDEPGADDAVSVDLLRRAGQFEKALSKCEEAIGRGYKGMVNNVLVYEKELITNKDGATHRMDEVAQ